MKFEVKIENNRYIQFKSLIITLKRLLEIGCSIRNVVSMTLQLGGSPYVLSSSCQHTTQQIITTIMFSKISFKLLVFIFKEIDLLSNLKMRTLSRTVHTFFMRVMSILKL